MISTTDDEHEGRSLRDRSRAWGRRTPAQPDAGTVGYPPRVPGLGWRQRVNFGVSTPLWDIVRGTRRT